MVSYIFSLNGEVKPTCGSMFSFIDFVDSDSYLLLCIDISFMVRVIDLICWKTGCKEILQSIKLLFTNVDVTLIIRKMKWRKNYAEHCTLRSRIDGASQLIVFQKKKNSDPPALISPHHLFINFLVFSEENNIFVTRLEILKLFIMCKQYFSFQKYVIVCFECCCSKKFHDSFFT